MKFDYYGLFLQSIIAFFSFLMIAGIIGQIYVGIVFSKYLYIYFSTGKRPESIPWKFWE